LVLASSTSDSLSVCKNSYVESAALGEAELFVERDRTCIIGEDIALVPESAGQEIGFGEVEGSIGHRFL
jgi:hypothetical protein